MKNTIVVILALSEDNDETEIVEWWRRTYLNHAKSVIDVLQSHESFSTKLVTSAQKEKFAAWKIDDIVTGIDFSDSVLVNEAVKGVYGVFVITELNYKSHQPLNDEVKRGRLIADVCLNLDIPHVIYSSLVHENAAIGLRSDVCDAKAHISDYMDKIKLKKTILYVPFLYEDFTNGFMKPMRTENPSIHKIEAPIGHIAMDMMSMRDVGVCVKSLFENSTHWVGKTVALSGDRMTLHEYATQMTETTYPIIIRDGKLSPEDFLKVFDVTGAEDMANYFDYLTRSVQRNNLSTTMILHPEIQSFYDWVNQNKDSLISLFPHVNKNFHNGPIC
uniref:nmrA-like family domain-containing protein 1 n=1 Tax=Styela clava TaxID=7725 RepID=UPI0019395A87|nr:nmrA-like family domain-containing protein 1 [Styela clava]